MAIPFREPATRDWPCDTTAELGNGDDQAGGGCAVAKRNALLRNGGHDQREKIQKLLPAISMPSGATAPMILKPMIARRRPLRSEIWGTITADVTPATPMRLMTTLMLPGE